ncbi:geranyl transferase [uncultured Brachyspira sp.]|uniref:geranyl transferase n=1 Tax=uncultured Brachyspira sp. TaxID=221953 RepID=UPI002588DC11|nr:geranyl transferase [uncultured Brachyspira sp.]
MEQYIINKLPNILKLNINIKTLKYISYDNSNNEHLTHSKKTAIDFDKVKDDYSTKNSLNKNAPKSNDALYISKNNTHYFIEFKNGNYRNFRKIDLISKIYDSLFILSDIKYEDGSQYIKNIVDFSKNYIYYILVYNSANNSNRQNYNLRFYIKSNLGLKKFKKFLLKEIYIYNEKEFEKALKTKFEIIK